MNSKATNSDNRMHLWESICIMIFMFLVLGILIIKYKMDPQIPLLLVFTVLLFYGYLRYFTWDEMFAGVVEGITPGIIPIMIFLLIGLLVATWLASGTIATIMVIGIHILSIRFFLPTIFIICGLVGMTIGSAFTTISTVGIALLGIGHIFGFPAPLTVGAIVSGAFFGNNMSPLSDTSNLTTSIAGVNLYDHLKNMAFTAVPAALITIVIYLFVGVPTTAVNSAKIQLMSSELSGHFQVSAWLLLPMLVVLILAWIKVPAIPTLLAGSLTAIGIFVVNHPHFSIAKIGDILMNGYHAHFGDATDGIMSGGGITGMLSSISLILCALALGGLLIKMGVVNTLINSIMQLVSRPGNLILMTSLSGIGVNLLVGEQYLSIILPGSAFKQAFHRQGIDSKYLSRTLATSGADVNALVPWGVSGIFIAGTLGVDPFQYIPLAFYPYLNPLITIILGYTFVSWKYRKQG